MEVKEGREHEVTVFPLWPDQPRFSIWESCMASFLLKQKKLVFCWLMSDTKKVVAGAEEVGQQEEHWLFYQRIWVWFPAPTQLRTVWSSSSRESDVSGLHEHCAQTCMQAKHPNTQNLKKKKDYWRHCAKKQNAVPTSEWVSFVSRGIMWNCEGRNTIVFSLTRSSIHNYSLDSILFYFKQLK